jgi:hypothetical protein
MAYQNELIPILLDTFEVHKIAIKNCQTILSPLESLLIKLYIQFHPELISRVIFSLNISNIQTLIDLI